MGSMKKFQKFAKNQRYHVPNYCKPAINYWIGRIHPDIIGIDKENFLLQFPKSNAALTEDFGFYGDHVTVSNEIKPALEWAKNSNKPAVIDVVVKYETHKIIRLLNQHFTI
jgi:thiamine pyrophosphate-dependent acetolactate synthase large subunit-like protein